MSREIWACSLEHSTRTRQPSVLTPQLSPQPSSERTPPNPGLSASRRFTLPSPPSRQVLNSHKAMIMSLRNQRRDVYLMNEHITAIVHAVVADGARDKRKSTGGTSATTSDGVSSSDTDANGNANAGSEYCSECGAACRCDETCSCRTPEVVLDAVGSGSTLRSASPYICTRY